MAMYAVNNQIVEWSLKVHRPRFAFLGMVFILMILSPGNIQRCYNSAKSRSQRRRTFAGGLGRKWRCRVLVYSF